MSADDPDVTCMLALQQGDRAAFNTLYTRWQRPVYRFVFRMLLRPAPAAAEEVTQEVFVRVYRARERYQPIASFRSWLFRIAAHLCSNERRRASARLELVGDVEPTEIATSSSDDPGAVAAARQLSDAVDRALLSLPERQRAAVLLARYEGCSMAEIGEVLDISVGAVKLLLHRAREQLRHDLAEFLPAEEAP